MSAKCSTLAVILSLAVSAAVADAALITSWENVDAATGTYSTTGVTEGDFSLAVNRPSGWAFTNILVRTEDAAAALGVELAAHPKLAVDVTAPNAAGTMFQFQFLFQNDSMSWVTSPLLVDMWESTPLTKATLTWDLSALSIPANLSWFNIAIIVNQSTAQTLYLDNLRTISDVVPEPSSAALAIVGGLLALVRRGARQA